MNQEKLIDAAKALCQAHGIQAIPYATGWWLIGNGISRVMGELAGLCASDLSPLPVMER